MTVLWQANNRKKKPIWFVPYVIKSEQIFFTKSSLWKNKFFITSLLAVFMLVGVMVLALSMLMLLGQFQETAIAKNHLSRYKPMYLLSHVNTICELDEEKCIVKILADSTIAGVGYHYPKDVIVWMQENIIVLFSSGINHDNIIKLPETSLVDFAVDFINDKIYVLDQLRLTVQAIDMFGRKYQSLVIGGEKLKKPKCIALDPYTRMMFITDDRMVFRGDMDGSNYQAIIHMPRDDLALARGWGEVAVDLYTRHIYCINEDYDHIERFTYSGSNRILIKSIKSWRIGNINAFNNHLYWIDVANNNSIMTIAVNENVGTVEPIKINASSYAIHFEVIPPPLQDSLQNPCSNVDDKCQHSCLLSNSALGYRCVCDMGWELASNGRNCTWVDNFFVYTDRNLIKFKSFNGTELYNPVLVSKANQRLNAVVSFAVDSHQKIVFHSDQFGNIYKTRLIDQYQEIVYHCKNICNVRLAYDWTSRNLYFIDSFSKILAVISTYGMVQHWKPLLTNLNDLEDVAVDPSAGYVFFSQSGNFGGINRVYTDGTNLVHFEGIHALRPALLTVDSTNKRLWWHDIESGIIQYSNYDGKNYEQFHTHFPMGDEISTVLRLQKPSPFDYQSINENIRKTIEADDNVINSFYLFNYNSSIKNLKVFGTKFQPVNHNNPCLVNNGNCLSFCFALPSEKLLGHFSKTCDL